MIPKRNRIIETVKAKLTLAFSIMDMGPISLYLGWKVEWNREKQTIKLSQLAYIKEIFIKFYFDNAYTINILMKKTVIFKQKIEKKASSFKKKRCHGITSSILFFMI